jgi:hypothetical protein
VTTGVSHTYGGSVVIVDMSDGKRWDLTPAMAMKAADKCEVAADAPADHTIIIIDALDERSMRFAGSREDMTAMARDLRHHVKEAVLKASPTNPEAA